MGRAFEYRKASKFARWDRMAKDFSRIGREIAMAIKEGGANPESNLRLKRAIINAKGVNMPKENVERAIKKASGVDADSWEEITYEGYGINGVAVFVECTTNNTTRTVANVRAIFNKFNGTLGKNGELTFLFDRKGIFRIDKEQIKLSKDDFELEMIDGGAEEVEFDENEVFVTVAFEDFGQMSAKLDELNIEVSNAELQRLPTITKNLNLEDTQTILKMIDRFQEDDDVQNVFHNMEIQEEISNQL